MRKAAVSGQFYPGDARELRKQIESCFKQDLGAGMPKVSMKLNKIYGAVVPHAGYTYSGACASHVYKEICELNKKDLPETFIILGPNHTGHGKSSFSLSMEDFETPLGIARNNNEFSELLVKKAEELNIDLKQDETANKYEHSIEVQLPFLQYIYSLINSQFNIVPVVVSTLDYDRCVNAADMIAGLIKEHNKKICILASSDFTHYGSSYGFMPFPSDKNTKDKLRQLDRNVINNILKFDYNNFYKEAVKTTICGTAAILIAIDMCKNLGAKKASLLKYYSSGDITSDYKNAVGYAAMTFI